MRVYFISGGQDGSSYVRCLLPMIHNGWWGQKTSLRGKTDSTDRMYEGAMSADVVVFQRPMQGEMLEAAKLLKLKGKKIVLDLDDTYSPHSGLPRLLGEMIEQQIDGKLEQVNNMLNDFVKEADLVTVTTPFLKAEYERFNKNVVVIPNMVDPDDWYTPKRNQSDKVRIGIVGSAVMNKDCQQITPLLRKLGRRDDVQLVILGMPSKKEVEARKFYMHEIAYWNTMNIEWHHAVPQADYMKKLNDLELDIMLIPREDNYFNHCKSNVKFLEASMCEIPVIAQGFSTGDSPYQSDLYVSICENLKEWEEAVESLINDKEMRLRMGKLAKQYVLENYNIKNTAHLWKDEYKKL